MATVTCTECRFLTQKIAGPALPTACDPPHPFGMTQRDNAPPGLAHTLKQRHLSMIAIAGVIGAGLFVGSGAAIGQAGPGVLISYALAGLLVVLVMRMLGEMSAANPETGSFSAYAERALGPQGRLLDRLAVLVVLGHRARDRGDRRGRDHPPVGARGAAVDVGADPHGDPHADQPLLRQLVRRVRVLVRRHQGRRDQRVPHSRRGSRSSGCCPASTRRGSAT